MVPPDDQLASLVGGAYRRRLRMGYLPCAMRAVANGTVITALGTSRSLAYSIGLTASYLYLTILLWELYSPTTVKVRYPTCRKRCIAYP